MLRWSWPLLVLTACGDNFLIDPDGGAGADDATTADSAVIVDAPETTVDSMMPDPPACTAEVTTDEANCGSCGNVCLGGQVCRNSACSCPTGIVPPIVFPTGTEQFLPLGIFTLALGPTLSLNGINGLVFGFNDSVPLNTNINLATVPLGSTPFVGTGVGLDIQSFALDASYIATGGTIRFTKRCATEIQGTITNATFSGLSSGGLLGLPTVDPAGCSVSVPFVSFHLRTAPCP